MMESATISKDSKIAIEGGSESGECNASTMQKVRIPHCNIAISTLTYAPDVILDALYL